MGLFLQSELDSTGVTGQYWRITQLNINMIRKDAIVTLELYVDKLARDSGKNPIGESIQIPLEGDLLDTLLDGITMKDTILAKAYDAFKVKAVAEASKPDNVPGDTSKNMQLAAFVNATDSK